MMHADIVILGAGPAGAAAGLLLAPHHRVILLDRVKEPAPKIGESLVPAARRLLRDMGILEAFEADRHPHYFGNRSSWGGTDSEIDFLRSPDGPGWHLDRTRFESFLRDTARQRGAELIAPAKLSGIRRERNQWRLDIECDAAQQHITAEILIDAGGRNAPLAQRLGAQSVAADRLVACWIRGTARERDGSTAGFSFVESEPNGWWYAAPVPDAEAGAAWVLAFHTDSDIIPDWARDGELLFRQAQALPRIGAMLSEVGFQRTAKLRSTAANSSHLAPVAGPGWLAIGDAALSFDPLASRGLFNALYTAWKAAEIYEGGFSHAETVSTYASHIAEIRASYSQHLTHSYSAEPRWLDNPFWQRRAASLPAHFDANT